MLKKNLFYNSLLSVSQFIFPLVTFPFASRVMGPHGIGSVNFIDSFTQYFLLFAALGIPVYGIREVSKLRFRQEDLNKTFTEIFCIHLISTVAFAIIYLIMGLTIPALRVHFDLVIIGIAIMFFNVFTVEWFYIGMEQFSYVTKRTIIVRVISIILLFVLLSWRADLKNYYLTFAAISVLTGISNFFILKKYVRLQFDGLHLKKHLKPLVIILGTALAVSVYILLDTIILGFLQGETAVGYYSAAVRVIRIPFAFIGAIAAVIIPQVTRAYMEGNTAEIKTLLNKSFTFICVIGFPITDGLLISSPFVINTFAGKNFHHSIVTLQILTPVILLVGINSIFGSQLLTPFGKEKQLLICVLIGMLCSLILNLILIPIFSFKGAAITNVATEIIVTLLCFYFARRHIKIEFDKKILFQSLLGAAVFVPISILIKNLRLGYTITELSVILACMLFYVCYFWFFVKNVYVENVRVLIRNKVFAFRDRIS